MNSGKFNVMIKPENAKTASKGRVKNFIAEHDVVLALITLFAAFRDYLCHI